MALKEPNERYFVKTNKYRGVTISSSWANTSEKGISVAVKAEAVRSRTTLAKVLGYKNSSVITRIVDELGVTRDIAEMLFADVKRFLWLAAVSSEKHLVPTPVIDECWHAFVLFTQDYKTFCHNHFGGFLHHAPQRDGQPRLKQTQLLGTIRAMHREFGRIPSRFWHYKPVAVVLI